MPWSNEPPEFTAEELNQLMSLGKRHQIYKDVRQLILEGEPYTDAQIRSLIKKT